jgi:RNA polymerase sigma factor (sigma-70 family)
MNSTSDTLLRQESLALAKQPRLSRGVNEIIELVNDPRTSVAKLTNAISKNRVLMKRVLRQANSPLYGFPRRVSDPNFAIVLLGFDALKEMVVRSVVSGAFRRMVNTMVRFEGFWNHSIGCALGSRLIAEKTGACDPDNAFVAGLLHDIGYVIINESINERFKSAGSNDIEREIATDGSSLSKMSHSEIGAWLVERWKLSSDIADAVLFHHTPAFSTVNPALTAVVHISEVLCHALNIGQLDYESVGGYDEKALGILGLDKHALTGESTSGLVALFRENISHAPKFESLVNDVKKNLIEVMGELSERERLVIALLYYEGLSMEDTAKVLDLSIADVEQQQLSALARLRAAITLMI